MGVLKMNFFDTPTMGQVIENDFQHFGVGASQPRYALFIAGDIVIHKLSPDYASSDPLQNNDNVFLLNAESGDERHRRAERSLSPGFHRVSSTLHYSILIAQSC